MNERYRSDLQAGLQFQDFVMHQFYKIGIPLCFYNAVQNQVTRGENMQGIEVKYDRRYQTTGNLFIEVRERSSPQSTWHAAGIMRDDCWGFAIGDYQKIWFLSTKLLRYLYLSDKYKTVTTETSVGFLLPIPVAERWCLFTLPKEENCEQRVGGSLPDNADRGPEGQ